jgi:hypothetical protein
LQEGGDRGLICLHLWDEIVSLKQNIFSLIIEGTIEKVLQLTMIVKSIENVLMNSNVFLKTTEW